VCAFCIRLSLIACVTSSLSLALVSAFRFLRALTLFLSLSFRIPYYFTVGHGLSSNRIESKQLILLLMILLLLFLFFCLSLSFSSSSSASSFVQFIDWIESIISLASRKNESMCCGGFVCVCFQLPRTQIDVIATGTTIGG